MYSFRKLEFQLYVFDILCVAFVGYLLLGEDVIDVLQSVYRVYDRLSATIMLLIGLSVSIEAGLVYLLHISIQQRNLDKFKIFWVAHTTLFIVVNCLHGIKLSQTVETVPHITIHITYFIWFWTFTFQAIPNFQFREALKCEKGFPVTGTMLGIRIQKLLFVQVGLQWIYFPNMMYLHYVLVKDAPEEMMVLLQPGEIGLVNAWTIRVVTLGLAGFSILLYFGIKKKSIAMIKTYLIIKVLLFIVLSAGTFTVDRVIHIHIPKLAPQSLMSSLYRTCLRLIFILELCELIYFIKFLRIRKEFPIEQLEQTESFPQNWNDDAKHIIRKVKISNWRIQLDTTLEFNKLGEGTFGDVYKGSLRKGICGLQNIPVAVKVLKFSKPDTSTDSMDSLFSELKSLLLTQNHPNLVKTFGIVWKKHSKGIVMEYCPLGSLNDYLKTVKTTSEFRNNVLEDQLREFQMWAIQIALAKEFIGLKNIVHGDLALRNILLDGNRTAKIIDFGMSIRLYNYQLYAKSNSSVLPWRWMAPESLTDLKFSSKSDVWSYGVTLWELYTVGQIPWSGMTWSSDFVTLLQNGLRLSKPSRATNSLYGSIMKRCWHWDQKLRISFKEILRNLALLSLKPDVGHRQ